MIRIYGEFSGQASLCRVSRGFASAFAGEPCFELTSWGNDLDDSHEGQPGGGAEVGLFVGNLTYLDTGKRGLHDKLWVMVAPNSDTLGGIVQKELATVSHLMTPSRWGRGVLLRYFPDKEVRVVPHGISDDFRPRTVMNRQQDSDTYRVLHLSSSILERKGTDKLLEGWKLANIPKGELYLSVPSGKSQDFTEMASALGISSSVKVTDRLDYDERGMATLYSSMDLVAQPSRGEGFGFVPLEARCCGTPALLTDCTGHSQHAGGRGTVIVKTGEDVLIDDFPGARAPELRSEDVADALVRAYSKRDQLAADAKAESAVLRNMWSWENQLKEFKNDVSRSISQ